MIDEIGCLPIDRQGANLFSQLINWRYEPGPMRSGISTAILDRQLHHALTLNFLGNSYRLKEKLKAGLVRSDESNPQPGGAN